jgi:hypothetical protein
MFIRLISRRATRSDLLTTLRSWKAGVAAGQEAIVATQHGRTKIKYFTRWGLCAVVIQLVPSWLVGLVWRDLRRVELIYCWSRAGCRRPRPRAG